MARTAARAEASGAEDAGASAAPSNASAAAHPGAAEVRDLVRASVAVASVAGLVGAAARVGLGQALTLLGQDAEDAGMPAPCWSHWHAAALPVVPGAAPGMRRPRALVWITVVSIVVKIGLNALLGFGLGPLPGLGLAGIGTSTSLVYLLSFGILCLVVRRDPALAPMLSLAGWRASPSSVRRLLRLGVPIAATYGSEAGFFWWSRW